MMPSEILRDARHCDAKRNPRIECTGIPMIATVYPDRNEAIGGEVMPGLGGEGAKPYPDSECPQDRSTRRRSWV